jgi:hypothetical protein
MSAVSVRGLFEAHLSVGDRDRSVAFYRDVVGLRLAIVLPERAVADPDGHLLEYVAMLDHEPRPDLGILSWSE